MCAQVFRLQGKSHSLLDDPRTNIVNENHVVHTHIHIHTRIHTYIHTYRINYDN